MKQRIFLSVLAACFSLLSANAQQEKPLFITAGSFQNITIGDNMTVVLTQAPVGENAVTIDNEASNYLKLTLSDGALQINVEKHLPKDAVVYIIVKDLRRLNVGENVVINTKGILNTTHLDIFIHGGSKAFLKSTGKVNAFAAGENEVVVKPY